MRLVCTMAKARILASVCSGVSAITLPMNRSRVGASDIAVHAGVRFNAGDALSRVALSTNTTLTARTTLLPIETTDALSVATQTSKDREFKPLRNRNCEAGMLAA